MCCIGKNDNYGALHISANPCHLFKIAIRGRALSCLAHNDDEGWFFGRQKCVIEFTKCSIKDSQYARDGKETVRFLCGKRAQRRSSALGQDSTRHGGLYPGRQNPVFQNSVPPALELDFSDGQNV